MLLHHAGGNLEQIREESDPFTASSHGYISGGYYCVMSRLLADTVGYISGRMNLIKGFKVLQYTPVSGGRGRKPHSSNGCYCCWVDAGWVCSSGLQR